MRVHKFSNEWGRRMVCDRSRLNSHGATEWELVTCLSCLKKKKEKSND